MQVCVVSGADGNGWEEREEGWEERKRDPAAKMSWLALLTLRDLTRFLSVSERTLNVDLLVCDLHVCTKRGVF